MEIVPLEPAKEAHPLGRRLGCPHLDPAPIQRPGHLLAEALVDGLHHTLRSAKIGLGQLERALLVVGVRQRPRAGSASKRPVASRAARS